MITANRFMSGGGGNDDQANKMDSSSADLTTSARSLEGVINLDR